MSEMDNLIAEQAIARGFVDEYGAVVLDQAAEFIGKYVVFPSPHCLTAVTLWAAHTHAGREFYVTPRLILDSAEPGSGKTRVIELLRLLVHAPILSISTTTAALYRRLDEGPRTVLLDETDAIFGKQSAPQHEDLRALLNAGYKRGATVDRCVGDGAKIKVVEFPVFAPVALAGLAGNMPATITTRAVTIHMRKRAPGEHVEPYRERDAEPYAEPLRTALAGWVGKHAPQLGNARPEMPEGVVDRPSEIWEALLAVADLAGGDWPKRAREACRYFVLDVDPGEMSLGVRLLADLRDVFGDADRMQTTDILERLCAIEEAPWPDMWGKPLDARRLSRELGRYGVAPAPFKDAADKTVKGYTTYPVDTKSAKSAGLIDAWRRYLPKVSGNDGNSGNPAGQSGYPQTPVTDGSVTDQDPETALTREVTPVTAVTGNHRWWVGSSQPEHPGCAGCAALRPGGAA